MERKENRGQQAIFHTLTTQHYASCERWQEKEKGSHLSISQGPDRLSGAEGDRGSRRASVELQGATRAAGAAGIATEAACRADAAGGVEA